MHATCNINYRIRYCWKSSQKGVVGAVFLCGKCINENVRANTIVCSSLPRINWRKILVHSRDIDPAILKRIITSYCRIDARSTWLCRLRQTKKNHSAPLEFHTFFALSPFFLLQKTVSPHTLTRANYFFSRPTARFDPRDTNKNSVKNGGKNIVRTIFRTVSSS